MSRGNHSWTDDEMDEDVFVSITKTCHLDREIQEDHHLSRILTTAELRLGSAVIGTAMMWHIPDARHNADFFLDCDAESADLSDLAAQLVSGSGSPSRRFFTGPLAYAEDVLLVDRFRIDPAYRRRGLGTAFVTRAVELIVCREPVLVATYPAPTEIPSEVRTAEDWRAVRNFWGSAGFVSAGGGAAVYAQQALPTGTWTNDDPDDIRAWSRRVRRPWPPIKTVPGGRAPEK